MPRLRKSASLGQLPLNTFASVQLHDCRKKALGVGGCAQQIGSFFKRFEVFEREHHHGQFAVACNNQGFVVVANSVHGAGEVRADGGIGHCIHNRSPNMYALMYSSDFHLSSESTEMSHNGPIKRYEIQGQGRFAFCSLFALFAES